jgi:Protein of unknown function (DUF3108)
LKLETARHFFVIALIVGALALLPNAQSAAQSSSEPFSPAPYKLGERLTYNVSFSSFVSAAHIEMLVAGRGNFYNREGIQLKGHVETIGMVNAALFAVNNDYVTYVDPGSGSPYYGQQIIRVASRTSETSAEFNEAAGTAAIPDKRTIGFVGSYDFLSAVYRIRALPLQDGQSYQLTVRGESGTYQVEIKVKGRQSIKTNVGSFSTISTDVHVETSGRDYDLKAFFSDDQRHVPVLVTTKLSAGEVRAELAGSEFIVTPAPPPPGAAPTPAPTRPSTPTGTDGDGALSEFPFKVGEQLNYQVYLPTITLPVGQATFLIKARSKYFDRDGLLLSLGAQTTNALQHLFFASDVVNSYVDPKTLLPFQSELNLVEGRMRSNTKLKINQDYGAATTDKGQRIEIPVGTHDYLSFFYALRALSIVPPRRSAVSILVNNKPKTLFIEALGRQTIQIGTQKIPAVHIALTTDDPEPDKYQLRVFVSEDRRKLPVRFTATTKLGALRADLAIIPVTSQ